MPIIATDQAPRSSPRCTAIAWAAALLAAVSTFVSAPASAGPIAESFRQWSQRRETRQHVEKPFSHQSGKVDLSVHPSAWSKLRSSGMATAMQGAAAARTAAQGNHSSVVGKLRDRFVSKGEKEKSGFQQTTEPMHHDQGMLSR